MSEKWGEYPIDSRLAKVARLASPGYGCCLRCGFPWTIVKGHDTEYEPHRYCFPLCHDCWWALLTPEARLPYYRRLVFSIWESADDWPAVERAVLTEAS